MEIENHIDSLLVELKIPSGRSPLDTRDEADAIVDKHVVPAVELVVEQKGRDFDARIPQIEIDVGRVRLQDLREAIESALSEALEKYRPSIITPFPDSVESLRDYVGSGFAPWKEGESPFNPTLLVSEVLDHEPSSVLESLDAFSEKELGHLQMLLSEISLSEETGGAVAALSLSSLHHFRDTVWARLMQGFPETAAILSARLSRWRSLLAEPDRADITVSGPGRPTFVYVGIKQSDIPVGVFVETREYTETPDERDPDYIVLPEDPSRYFRKVRVGEVGEIDEKKGISASTSENVSEDGAEDIGGKKERLKQAAGGKEESEERRDSGQDRWDKALSQEKEQMPEGPGRTHSSFRYVAVRLSDIPVGAPVEAREYTENPTEKDPDYIVTFDIPSRYFWKVRVGEVGEVDEKTEISASTSENVSEDGAENIEGKKERLKQAAGGKEESEERRDSGQDRWDKALSQEKEQRTEERGRSRTSFRYVEINRFEVPVSYPLEIREPSDNPAPEDPEYVASPGSPVKYFKKTVVEKSIVSMGLDSAELPGRIADTPEIWGIQDFELDVTESRIPISDAGLVLLHPFLGRMMENLGLVKEGDFVSPLARIRAVHLLRDLTGSKEPHYNHHLLLEKILCALPVGYIIPSEWKPTSREKEEIKSLLEAVCDYWEPLSSSSTEALCGTFLRRPGSIERFEDSWIIRVEGHTVDILLDELPWELSIVYLPWLERPLAVEWQHE